MLKTKFLILFILIISIFSCTKDINTNITDSGYDPCQKRTIPEARLSEYNTNAIASTANGWTPNVVFYEEYDYAVYTFFGSDTAKAFDYIRQLQGWQKAMYAKDSVIITFVTKLWTTPSPYGGSISSQLDQFSLRIDSMSKNGTLPKADFFYLNQHKNYGGGEAYLGTMCISLKKYKTGCSYINCSLTGMPKYCWDVNVNIHEKGHLLGCNHTHDCAWNGNNTKMDDCGGTAGYTGSGGACTPLPIPLLPPNNIISYGHPMSYCHLNAGVNLNYGFVDQPGALVRYNLFTYKSCLISPDDTIIVQPDTCTTYVVSKTTQACPSGQTGLITTTVTNICPNHVQITTVTNTCKDTVSTSMWIICCSFPRIINGSITIRTNDIIVNATGFTNYTYFWTDLTTGEKKYTVSNTKDACGNLKYITKAGWGQTVSKTLLVKGHTYQCEIRSTSQTTTTCYKPGFCSKTY